MRSLHHVKMAIKRTKRRFSTDFYIKKAVLLAAHKALVGVFGPNYSTRCLQSSIVIHNLLNYIGIRSEMHVGIACFGRALVEENDSVGWGGFWGNEKHVWVVSEYDEIIDLTVSQLHEHPKSETKDEPIPIIWYGSNNDLPVIINYLPYSHARWELSSDENEEIERCNAAALLHLEVYMSKPTIVEELPAPILTGPFLLQQMHADGNRWLNKCIVMQHIKMPLPDDFK